MNGYYVEFHARERVAELQSEAAAMRRARSVPRRLAHPSETAGARQPGVGRLHRWRVRLIVASVFLVALAGLLARPAAAAGAATDRVADVDSVVAVAFPEDYPVASIMRMECAFVHRVQTPDGSARETQSCRLSDEPVMIPEFQGSPPDTALTYRGGACEWASDYWYAKTESTVYAESYRVVLTPSGMVHVTSAYPAEPLDCG
jgi:hypothetical protein